MMPNAAGFVAGVIAQHPLHGDEVLRYLAQLQQQSRPADAAVYLAKHAGRNLCISAGMEL